MFKIRNDRFVIRIALILSIMALFTIALQFIFSRFLHYDKQNRLLHPDHYVAQLVTKDEFNQISDPNVRTIGLANGSQFTKADWPEWEKEMIPYYKSIDNGDYYIKVITKGTAHVLRDCFSTVLGSIIMNLFIVAYCINHLVKSGRNQSGTLAP